MAFAAFAGVSSANAQVITNQTVSPSTFSRAGQTITFTITIDSGNRVASSASVTSSAVGANYSCPIADTTNTNVTFTCTGTYTTTITDVDNAVIQELAVVRMLSNGTPIDLTGSLQTVTYVAPDPNASISVSPSAVAEDGAPNLVYTITLDQPAPADTTVSYAVSGTATSGTDYPALTLSRTILAGSTTATVTVNPTADVAIEADETVTLTLQSGAGYAVALPSSATGTILNDDLPSLTVNDVTLNEGNSGTTNFSFTVSLSAPAGPGGVTFDIATADGSATAGSDYAARSLTSQTIPAGSSSYTFALPVNGDTTFESDETFFVNVTNVVNAVVTDGQGVGTITNDDSNLPTATIAVAPGAVLENGGTPLVYTVTLSAAQSSLVVVDLAQSGTATAGGDFLGGASNLVFNAGETTQSFNITPQGDLGIEPDETVVYTIVPAASYTVGAPSSATGTITNDDFAPVVTSISPATGPAEGGTAVTITGSRFTGATAAFVGGRPLTDFVVVSDTQITGTTGFSPPGFRNVQVSNASGAGTLTNGFLFTNTAFISSVSSTQLAEDSGQSFTFNLALAFTSGSPTVIDLAYSGTADSATDYTGNVASVTIPAGQSTGSVTITPTSDTTVEPNETITLSIVPSAEVLAGGPSSRTVTILNDDSPVTIAPASLPGGTVGTAYNQTITSSGGVSPTTFAVTAGALPNGLTLATNGALTGTPTAAGSFNFTVTATDSSGAPGPFTASQNYSVTIAAPTLAITPAAGTLTATYNAAYSQAFTASGGTGSYSYAITGALPTGLSFSGNTISGTPIAPGSYAISITATDTLATGAGSPFSVTQNYTLNVPAPTITVTPASLPGATVASAFSQTLTASGGAGPYGFTISGALPAGITLSGSTLSGTPTQAGTFPITVTASDANGQTGSRNYTLTVAAPTLAITPAAGALPITYATPFSRSFAASGGVGPYTYALTGTLPAGLTFTAATATVAGTPTTSGNFAFTITATDTGSSGTGSPFSVASDYTLAIAAPTITVTPSPLPNATAGQAYSTTLVGGGAVAPYTFTLTGGTLPAGVTLSNSGLLSGTPIASGTFPITVLVRDTNGQQGSVNLSLTVAVPTLTVTPTTIPAANYGIAYSQAITATGGIAPYSYTVTSGALPTGLTLNPTTGLISGTPLQSGAFPFAITVRDSTAGTAATATVNFSLQVAVRPDPASDPEVRGLVQAQAEASRRFATTQISNFRDRLDRLHYATDNLDNTGRISFSNGLRMSGRDVCRDTIVRATARECAAQRGTAADTPTFVSLGQASMIDPATASLANGAVFTQASFAGGNGNAANLGTAVGMASAAPATVAGGPAATPRIGVWTAGQIRFGEQNGGVGTSSFDFQSEGVTIGADYRLNSTFAAGLGLGYGRDKVDVGDNGTRSRGEAITVAAYGSYLPAKNVFIDTIIGYQWFDFDLRRFVTSTGALVGSQRDGGQVFGSIALGADIAAGKWQLTPYTRFELSRAKLDAYRENSGSVFDLAYQEQSFGSTSLGLGGRARYSHNLGWARLYPELSAEYQWQLDSNGDVLVAYADQVTGPFSAIRLNGLDRDVLTLGSKVDLELVTQWMFGLEYTARIASGAGSDNAVKLSITRSF